MAIDAALGEIAVVHGHILAVVGPGDTRRRTRAAEICLTVAEHAEARIGVAQDPPRALGFAEEDVAGSAAHGAVRPRCKIRHDLRVAVIALEDGRMFGGPRHGFVSTPGMAVPTTVDQRVQARVPQIAIHVERLVGIVAVDAERGRILDTDKTVMFLDLYLSKLTRSSEQQAMTDKARVFTVGTMDIAVTVGSDVKRAWAVTGLALHPGVRVFGVQIRQLVVALGAGCLADVVHVGLEGVGNSRSLEMFVFAK